jgi:hypothetical protein
MQRSGIHAAERRTPANRTHLSTREGDAGSGRERGRARIGQNGGSLPSEVRDAHAVHEHSALRALHPGDVIAIFGWPGYERARDLTPLALQWSPDVVVHEAADYAGWEVSAATGALSVAHGYGPHQAHTLELIKDVCSAAVEELGTSDRFDSVLASLYVDPRPVALRSDEPSPWTDVLGVRPEPRRSDLLASLPPEVIAMTEEPIVYVTSAPCSVRLRHLRWCWRRSAVCPAT